MSFKSIIAGLAVVAASAFPVAAQAPSGRISIVVPYGPGGATDIVARIVAEGMQEALGTTVIVENKPGAFGISAMEYVAAADADGTTLLMHNVTTGGLTPQFYASQISFDVENDFRPVARIAQFAGLYVASTASDPAFTSAEELIDWARANPGRLRMGNAGLNSIPHLGALLFSADAGIEANHIPSTSGGSGMTADLVNGDLHVAGVNEAGAANLVATGQGVVILTSSSARLDSFPDVPSVTELGIRTVGSGNWQAIFARSSVPDEVIEALRDAMRAAVTSERGTELLANANAQIDYEDGSEALATWYQGELDSLGATLEELSIEATN